MVALHSFVMAGKELCQQFTALGQIRDDVIYHGFHPLPAGCGFFTLSGSIHPLLDQLSFTQGKSNWGWLFHRGHFEISQEDFLLIKRAMHA